MIWFLLNCRRLIAFPVLLTMLLPLPAFGQQGDSVPVDTADPTRWFRHTFNVDSSSESAALVGLTDPSACRVWLNGQRLRPDSEGGVTAAFQVTQLLRGGTNCLAIESRGAKQSVPVAVRLGSQLPRKIACRMKTVMPPIGWQKTDFNDKDWKAIQLELPTIDWDAAPISALKPKQTASRIQDGQFRFHDGDHVVLLGGTFIERAQRFGHLEAALMLSNAKRLTFRNLGWSADTVFAESRGIFDRPAKGYARMIEHVRAEEPDVVVIQYGQNEAMQQTTTADSEKFARQLKQLISDIKVTTEEVVLVTPHPLLQTPPPLPDASMWNDVLSQYADTVTKVAEQSGCRCVNLFDDFEHRLLAAAETVGFWRAGLSAAEHPDLKVALLNSLSDNGMHWNSRGYRCISLMFADSVFGETASDLSIVVKAKGDSLTVSSSVASTILVMPKSIDIKLASSWLQPGLLAVDIYQPAGTLASCQVTSQGGTKTLVGMPTAESTVVDIKASRFQLGDDYERLVQLLTQKNELYFHRWRPQNITYLFGFRKHEQGNNASEIAEYDPLIADFEQQIQALLNSAGPTIRLELQ